MGKTYNGVGVRMDVEPTWKRKTCKTCALFGHTYCPKVTEYHYNFAKLSNRACERYEPR